MPSSRDCFEDEMGHKVVPGSVDDSLAEESKPPFFPHLKISVRGALPTGPR